MSGNVWERTRSLWGKEYDTPSHKYPYRPDDARRENLEAEDDVLRVLRGGSFLSSENDLRAAFRFRFFPDLRYDYIGFRLVSSRLRS